MRLTQLRQRLADFGAKPCHQDRVLRAWCGSGTLDNRRSRAEDFLPAALRADLPAFFAQTEGLVRLVSEHPGGDGSARLLVALADGRTVESVRLLRQGLCVSTQVGCAVACRFCMTGRDGLLQQLGSAEIVAQVALARRARPVRRVVFMGMGEPAHNLDNVLEAIEFLGTLGGIGHKNLVFSTVGDRRVFERLPAGPVKPALALSLHSTFRERRAALLPKAADLDPAELLAESEAYARATGYPLQVQWTLLAGVNDGDDEAERLAELLRGRYAMVNFIPYNANEGLGYQRPSAERCAALVETLMRRGILTKLRNSAGQDIDGGCGQLRARHLAGEGAGRPLRFSESAG
ncbi:MAG: RNA methyltransferase [Dechloromonas sp.]|jgi:23S rRNA (adenine2503-C2)-methyltransferase|nr:RNA methyltransferase [Dechloromonas sp.]